MVFLAVLVATALLWNPKTSDGLPVSPRPNSKLLEGKQHECWKDSDCGDLETVTCTRDVCKCKATNYVYSPSAGCLPVKQLGEDCVEDVQCQVLEKNATCEEKFCACDSGSYLPHDANGTLCTSKTAGSEETNRSAVDINMIIILAVLAIMFLGICVALHLFSKARFRNRRTIFNSPHPRLMHIKLGKRKKSSIRTQHLPPPPGHLVTRHHSFSGQQTSFPACKVPKTRSHECLRTALSRGPSPKFERRPKTAPLADWESLPSSEDLEKKTPEPLRNGLPSFLSEEESHPKAPGSPTVIITDADGAHTVVTSASPSSGSAVNV